MKAKLHTRITGWNCLLYTVFNTQAGGVKILALTYGAIRRRRLLALKLMRITNVCLTTNVSAEYRTASFV